MTNDMKQHEAMIKQRLEQTLSSGELTQLAAFHARRIAEFQHERLVHLLVTMFFACLLFAATWLFFAAVPAGLLLSVLTGVLTLILFVLELFYIRHYYYLENGTQRLYRLTVAIEKRRAGDRNDTVAI